MSQTADISPIQKNGMSLVELLVAMAIFTIIMSSVMVMFNTITGAVRRSYSTMDLFDATHGAIMAIERDVQSTFSAPATGADFHFYGEPNGFVFVGIAPNGHLGRLSYAVHADTSRMTAPFSDQWRGEIVTLPVKRADMESKYPGDPYYPPFSTMYPGTDEYVDVQVEVVYGLLLRYFESDVNQVTEFDDLVNNKNTIDNLSFVSRSVPPHLPMPALFRGGGSEGLYRTEGLPWVLRYVWGYTNPGSMPSSHIREKMETLEKLHFWMQMLNGPRIMPSGTGYLPWAYDPVSGLYNPYAIWEVTDVFDQFWYDHIPFRNLSGADVAALGLPTGFNMFNPSPGSTTDQYGRHFLWDHVVARDFAINVWLIDPANGQRIKTDENVVDIQPVFRYDVENIIANDQAQTGNFNTLFNMNFDDGADDDNDLMTLLGVGNAFDALMEVLVKDETNNVAISAAVEEMTASHQFYEVGDPIQSRLPSAFEINLYVVSPPVTTGAPPDVFEFNQIIHIPSGFLRRSLSVD